jgi:hypothetical protein
MQNVNRREVMRGIVATGLGLGMGVGAASAVSAQERGPVIPPASKPREAVVPAGIAPILSVGEKPAAPKLDVVQAAPLFVPGEAPAPIGVPDSVVTEPRVEVMGVQYGSGFIRSANEGLAWKTTPPQGGNRIIVNNGDVVDTGNVEAGRIFQVGPTSSKGRFNEVKVMVDGDSYFFISQGFGRVELSDCGQVSDYPEKGRNSEVKRWYVMNADCACPPGKKFEVVLKDGPEGDTIFQRWPLAHTGEETIRKSQLDQFIENARKGQIDDLSMQFFRKQTGEYAQYGANPQTGTAMNFIRSNAVLG